MKKLKLDLGMEEYRVGGGVLRFNPCDPALYERFLALLEEWEGSCPGSYKEAESLLRARLEAVFPGNDLAAIFPGSLLALCGNGKLLVVNFLEALQPVLLSGARRYAEAGL